MNGDYSYITQNLMLLLPFDIGAFWPGRDLGSFRNFALSYWTPYNWHKNWLSQIFQENPRKPVKREVFWEYLGKYNTDGVHFWSGSTKHPYWNPGTISCRPAKKLTKYFLANDSMAQFAKIKFPEVHIFLPLWHSPCLTHFSTKIFRPKEKFF